MLEKASSHRNSEAERGRALIYADIVSKSLYLMVDQLGSNADLAKKIIEDANSKLPSFSFVNNEDIGSELPRLYFSFISSLELPRDKRDEIVFSLGVMPLRDPLILIKTMKEIDGKVYHTERALCTDIKGVKPIMSFWQASWEPKNKSSVPQPVQVDIVDAGLPILGLGTPNEQRVSMEKSFEKFIAPY